MNKAYTNWITWVNYPSTNSPINETALNLLSNAVDTIDDRVVTFDTTKANQSDLLLAIKAISFNQSTGTFVFTLFNNNTITIDTDIEKIAVNFDYDDDPTSAHYQSLVLTLSDGTIKYIDLSALITQYEFEDTSTIHANVSSVSGHVSFNVIDGSITTSKLDPAVLASIQASVAAAEAHMLNSQAWAEGKKGSTDVTQSDPQYHNNSKYFANLAAGYATSAETSAQEAAASALQAKGHRILNKSGTQMTQRRDLQFIGDGVKSVTDDSTNNKTVIEIEGGGSSAGHTILNQNGTAMNQRTKMQFLDATLSDDSTNDKTKIEVVKQVSDVSDIENLPDGIYQTTNEDDLPFNADDIFYDGTETSTVKDALDSVFAFHTFNVPVSLWEANADTSTNEEYPYIAEISCNYYSNASHPSWQMNGVGAIPTGDEVAACNLVTEMLVDENSITLYATDEVTVALVLEVGGEAKQAEPMMAEDVYLSDGHTSVEEAISDILEKETWSSVVSGVVGDTTITITDSAIRTTSRIEIFPQTASGGYPNITKSVATAGQLVITCDALTEATDFQLHIYNL